MKITKLLYLIFLLLGMFFLQGCIFKVYDIYKVQKVLTKYYEITDVEMTNTVSILTSQETVQTSSKVIKKMIDGKQQMCVEISGAKTYYQDGYACTQTNGEYVVTKDSYDESQTDLNKAKYKVETKKENGNIIYTIKFDNDGVQEYIEKMIGFFLDRTPFSMVLIIVVNTDTNTLKSLEEKIVIGTSPDVVVIDSLSVIDTTGENVLLEVPKEVNDSFYFYIHGDRYEAVNPPIINPTPDPEPLNYTNNEVIKYYQLGTFKQLLYDAKTNVIAVVRDTKIDIYNAQTITFERSISFPKSISYADIDQGRLAVCFYLNNDIYIVDLTNNDEVQIIYTQLTVLQLALDNNTLYYTDFSQHAFYDLSTSTILKQFSLSNMVVRINRKDHIIYIINPYYENISYYNSQTGEEISHGVISLDAYKIERILIDGKCLHVDGYTLDLKRARIISSNNLNRIYPSFDSFTPDITLYDSDELAFIGSQVYQNKVGIYDNIHNNFIYCFSLKYGSIIDVGNNQFIAVSGDKDHIATVDINQIKDDKINDQFITKPQETISNNGKISTLENIKYTQSCVTDKYIYTINENEQTLNVYDVKTLEKVYSEQFLLKPTCLNATSQSLVIGFGHAYQFRIYNTTDWSYETVDTTDPIYSIIIYEDRIIYSYIDELSFVRVYDIKSHMYTQLHFNGNFCGMDLNRESGIIYFSQSLGYESKLIYYNMENNRIFKSVTSNHNANVYFDGNFVHCGKEIFDTTGKKISRTDLARIYQNTDNYTKMSTIIDNNEISVYTAFIDERYITVVYDLQTNQDLYTLEDKYVKGKIFDNKIIMVNDNDQIVLLNLN